MKVLYVIEVYKSNIIGHLSVPIDTESEKDIELLKEVFSLEVDSMTIKNRFELAESEFNLFKEIGDKNAEFYKENL